MTSETRNCQNCFDAYDVEDSKNLVLVTEVKDSMDAYHFGFKSELIYESHGLTRVYDVQFSHLSYDDSHLGYCDSCHNSQNLFGCVGLKQGSYAIFNKQYSEEDYAALKEKIIAHMRETKEYGEFFPPALSPFGYNETQGQVYMPLEKEEALRRGYKWAEDLPGTFGKETLKPDQTPDNIKDVPDSILKEILACTACGRNYNIVEPELQFYRRETIPIPRRCPDCRYKARIAQRPARHTHPKNCDCKVSTHAHGSAVCPNKLDTPFTEKDSAKIYCEACYQNEVV